MTPARKPASSIKQGLYARYFTREEIAGLREMPDNDLTFEINMLRVLIARTIELSVAEPDLEKSVWALNSISLATSRLNILIRTQVKLNSTQTPLDEVLAAALAEEPFYIEDPDQGEDPGSGEAGSTGSVSNGPDFAWPAFPFPEKIQTPNLELPKTSYFGKPRKPHPGMSRKPHPGRLRTPQPVKPRLHLRHWAHPQILPETKSAALPLKSPNPVKNGFLNHLSSHPEDCLKSSSLGSGIPRSHDLTHLYLSITAECSSLVFHPLSCTSRNTSEKFDVFPSNLRSWRGRLHPGNSLLIPVSPLLNTKRRLVPT